MTPDAAVAYTAFLVCAAGFIAAIVGFTIPIDDERSSVVRALRVVGLVGVGAMLSALVMWIISIWMQVR